MGSLHGLDKRLQSAEALVLAGAAEALLDFDDNSQAKSLLALERLATFKIGRLAIEHARGVAVDDEDRWLPWAASLVLRLREGTSVGLAANEMAKGMQENTFDQALAKAAALVRMGAAACLVDLLSMEAGETQHALILAVYRLSTFVKGRSALINARVVPTLKGLPRRGCERRTQELAVQILLELDDEGRSLVVEAAWEEVAETMSPRPLHAVA